MLSPRHTFENWIFLLRFFTLCIFFISPLNSFLQDKTIAAIQSLLIGKKKLFSIQPSSTAFVKFFLILNYLFLLFNDQAVTKFQVTRCKIFDFILYPYTIVNCFLSCWTALTQCCFMNRMNIIMGRVAHVLSLNDGSWAKIH